MRHCVGGDREDVGRSGEERERQIRPLALHGQGEGIDRGTHPQVGHPVGVHVVAEDHPTLQAAKPLGSGTEVGQQVQPGVGCYRGGVSAG